MNQLVDDVRAFHEVCDLPIAAIRVIPPDFTLLERELNGISGALLRAAKNLQHLASHPDMNDADRLLAGRARYLVEELGETLVALVQGDEAEVLDGLADLIYVAVGAAITLDLPLTEAWAEVQATNMAKAPGGAVVRDAAGKIMKPPGWSPPDLVAVLARYRAGQLLTAEPSTP